MLLVVMVMSVGSAWGEEVEIWSGTHTSSYWQITADKFSSATTSDALRVYVSSPGDIWLNDASWGKLWTGYTGDGTYSTTCIYYNSSGWYEFPFSEGSFLSTLQSKGLYIQSKGATITRVTIVPTAVDEFLSTATPTRDTGDSYELPSRSETSYTLSMTKPLTYVASPKYARFQVLNCR